MSSFALISAQDLLAKIYSDLGIVNKAREGDIIEWLYECLSIAGISMNLEEKEPIDITITDHKGKLPCNILDVVGIQFKGTFLRSSKSIGHSNLDKASGNKNVGLTYSINYPYLNLDLKEGNVTLFYTGFKEDEDGFPLLPEYIYFTEGCVFYVLYKLKLSALLSNKSSLQEVNSLKQLAMENLATATRMLNMVSVDEWQDVVNNNLTLRPNLMRHTTGFKSTRLYPEIFDECFSYRVRQGLR
jgi:hypothetical protein